MTTNLKPRKHTIDARGLRFHYVEWGEPRAPAVVLLHGLSAMCRIWDRLAIALQDRYHLLALDQRGHGETSWPEAPDYGTGDYLGDLEALVETWKLDRFALVGLSMGGINAMAFAARHRERITHLVVVDIRPAVSEKRPGIEQAKTTAEQGHPILATIDAAVAMRKLSHPYTSDDAIRHHVEYQCKQLPDGRWTYKQDPRASYYWRAENLWQELPKIDVPVLIVRGGRSDVLPAGTAREMLDAFPNAELIAIADAGHTVPEDRPEEFIKAVEDFFAKHPA